MVLLSRCRWLKGYNANKIKSIHGLLKKNTVVGAYVFETGIFDVITFWQDFAQTYHRIQKSREQFSIPM